MMLRMPTVLLEILRSRPLSAALATAGVLVAATSFLWVRLTGWPGYLGALGILIVLMALVLIARYDEIEGVVVPPLSLLAFVGWAGASVLWSSYQWVTLGGMAYLLAVTAIALFIAFTRDTLQIIRAFGDALRLVLGLSLGIEIFAGLVIDMPIPYLNVTARIAELGPISGILQTRNQLGTIAIIAAIGFATEWRTQSVTRTTSILSMAGAGACILLTRSPVIITTAGLVVVAAGVLYLVRRVRPERRQPWQFAILGLTTIGVVLAWVFRDTLIAVTNSGGQLDYRLGVWSRMLELVSDRVATGWGWTGRWHPDVPPFMTITTPNAQPPLSGLNAYIDVLFQLGAVGVALLAVTLALAFARSWLLAGRRRSIIYAWPALSLLALILISTAESSLLAEFGWFVFVVCSVKASQELSWRTAFSRVTAPELPHSYEG